MNSNTTPIVPPPASSPLPPPPMLPPGHHERRLVLGALLAVLVIGGAAILYWETAMKPAEAPAAPAEPSSPASDVVVTNALTASSTVKSLPGGFPADIPLEQGTLVESYKAAYTSRSAIQYSASYLSSKSIADLSAEYSAYMKTAGYTADASGRAGGVLSGTKGNDSLMVVVSTQAGKSFVQVSYLARS